MAGHMVSQYLRENDFVVDTLAAQKPFDQNTTLIDISDLQKFRRFLAARSYDVLINCIGLLVKESEEKKDLAVYINSYLPHFLENHFKNTSTRVIHLSTDDVFSYHGQPPQEKSPYSPETFYGRSKALGEIINAKDLTFRMSIVGPDMRVPGTGLLNWFFEQKGEIQGYTKTIWNGVTTLELAKAIKAAVEQNLTGLYHLVPKRGISKYDLLQLFQAVFERPGIIIKPVDGIAINKTLKNTRKDFQYQVPDYPAMLKELKVWIEAHHNLYPHYARP